MEIRFIEKKEDWNKLVVEARPNQFLQSWEWGEFQRSLGRRVWCLVIERDGETAALGQAIEHALPFGLTYIYLPRGPLVTALGQNHGEELAKIFSSEIKKLAKKSIFARVESVNLDFGKFGWRRAREVQPNHTLILSLDKSEEDLLADMHQKTRYNIRLGEKHGVTVRPMKEDEFDIFWQLVRETTERDQFRAHPRDYYKKMVAALGDKMCQVWFAEFEGRVIAANLMIFWGDAAVYLHGASSRENKNVMAPYLLHWEMIKKAKAEGFEYYDFWGIAPPESPHHPWAGITRFKKGFGGTEVAYPGGYDLPFNKFWYNLYRIRTR